MPFYRKLKTLLRSEGQKPGKDQNTQEDVKDESSGSGENEEEVTPETRSWPDLPASSTAVGSEVKASMSEPRIQESDTNGMNRQINSNPTHGHSKEKPSKDNELIKLTKKLSILEGELEWTEKENNRIRTTIQALRKQAVFIRNSRSHMKNEFFRDMERFSPQDLKRTISSMTNSRQTMKLLGVIFYHMKQYTALVTRLNEMSSGDEMTEDNAPSSPGVQDGDEYAECARFLADLLESKEEK